MIKEKNRNQLSHRYLVIPFSQFPPLLSVICFVILTFFSHSVRFVDLPAVVLSVLSDGHYSRYKADYENTCQMHSTKS